MFFIKKCECNNLKPQTTGWLEEKHFEKMLLVEEVNHKSIVQCNECRQLWLVEPFDRGANMLAVKLDQATNNELTYFNYHVNKLVEKYGINENSNCKMSGCENKSLNQKFYCSSCLITKLFVYE